MKTKESTLTVLESYIRAADWVRDASEQTDEHSIATSTVYFDFDSPSDFRDGWRNS